MLHDLFHEYELTDDPTRLEPDLVCGFLARSYWASERGRDVILRSIGNSICYGAYHAGQQVAFARVVTDQAVMFWLCDVFVAEEHRGRGLGTKLVEVILGDPRLKGLTGLLATRDAHSLYERFGFRRDGQRLMFRPPFPVDGGNPHAATPNRAAVA